MKLVQEDFFSQLFPYVFAMDYNPVVGRLHIELTIPPNLRLDYDIIHELFISDSDLQILGERGKPMRIKGTFKSSVVAHTFYTLYIKYERKL